MVREVSRATVGSCAPSPGIFLLRLAPACVALDAWGRALLPALELPSPYPGRHPNTLATPLPLSTAPTRSSTPAPSTPARSPRWGRAGAWCVCSPPRRALKRCMRSRPRAWPSLQRPSPPQTRRLAPPCRCARPRTRPQRMRGASPGPPLHCSHPLRPCLCHRRGFRRARTTGVPPHPWRPPSPPPPPPPPPGGPARGGGGRGGAMRRWTCWCQR